MPYSLHRPCRICVHMIVVVDVGVGVRVRACTCVCPFGSVCLSVSLYEQY